MMPNPFTPPPEGAPPMAVPAPPPKLGAPQRLLDLWADLSRDVVAEERARRFLALTKAEQWPHSMVKAAEEDLAFAEHTTAATREIYNMEYQDSYPDFDTKQSA